ncbi:MAG TPA: type II toxin-antitoxin system VapC family toxin [Terriglobia bacterium]|nr:type II toxin-antitoxin system VapC family toxin [Terriglobia bacterium]
MSGEFGYVLDASAVLVYLQREPGYEKVRDALARGAAVSTVNLAEVYAKLLDRNLPWGEIGRGLEALGLSAIPFTDEDARESASLYPKARRLGLSLGDRACLALGVRLGLPVLSADRAWKGFEGVKLEMVR